jgi:hypothetical protein
MAIQIQLVRGTSDDFPFQVPNSDGTPAVGLFAFGDTISAKVWQGQDITALVTPAASWLGDPTNAQFQISFNDADSTSLEFATYLIQAWASRAGRTVRLLPVGSTIEIIATPGAGVSRPVYCSYQDMEDECNWIGQFQGDRDQTGFAAQRAKARLWMDSLILRAAPVSGPGSLISRQSWWSWATAGVDPRNGTGLAMDTVLAGYLSSNKLVLTGPQGSGIVTATACYAISLVLRAQPGLSGNQAQLPSYFMLRAQSEASRVVAEIDIDGSGHPAYAISLGVTNTRYA